MPTPLKLLILEDNAFDAALEVEKLQAAGYDCAWQQVQTRLEVEETERRRIARDLHDGVGQLLTAVKLRLAGLNPNSVDYGSRRGECVAAIDEALEQVRRVSRDLRPSQLDDLGLVAALRSHLDRQAGSAGFKPNFAHARVPSRLAPQIETTCFRLAPEALTNIARHAQASEVWITLAGTEEELRLEVRDNGRGFDVSAARLGATAGKSMGLLSMEERATLAGGRLVIDSALGRETRLSPALPLVLGGPGQA